MYIAYYVRVDCSCFFFKQKTAYDMRISYWSSDVCSADLRGNRKPPPPALPTAIRASVPLPLVSAQLVLSSRRCQAPTHEYLRRSYHRRRSRRVGSRVAACRSGLEGPPLRDARLGRDDTRAPDRRPRRTGLLEQLPFGRCGEQRGRAAPRSEEHTSELQSLMRISSAVFCLKKKK